MLVLQRIMGWELRNTSRPPESDMPGLGVWDWQLPNEEVGRVHRFQCFRSSAFDDQGLSGFIPEVYPNLRRGWIGTWLIVLRGTIR